MATQQAGISLRIGREEGMYSPGVRGARGKGYPNPWPRKGCEILPTRVVLDAVAGAREGIGDTILDSWAYATTCWEASEEEGCDCPDAEPRGG
jgi:hypothetical protein